MFLSFLSWRISNQSAQGGSNYNSWRFKLNLILKSKNLFATAMGATSNPEGNADDAEVKSWVKSDLDAQTLIGLNVSSNIANKISSCKSAFKMLEKLEKSDLTVESLRRQFFSYSCNVSVSAVENCQTLIQIAEDLCEQGETVKEEWIMTRILGLLPTKLHHLRTVWDNVSGTDKTVSVLTTSGRRSTQTERRIKSKQTKTHSCRPMSRRQTHRGSQPENVSSAERKAM